MRFRLLGSLVACVGDADVRVTARLPRLILGVLIVNANRVVSLEELSEALWGGEPPDGGVKTLRYHVSQLRRSLRSADGSREAEVIETADRGYRLVVSNGDLDASVFEQLASDGRERLASGQNAQASDVLADALALWRGEALEDFRYEEFAQGEIARLEELRLVCLEDRIDADLELGRHRGLLGDLQQLTIEFPLRERFWAQLMLALYRCDQQADALRAYASARTLLGEELGIEPGDALRRLETQILRHELPVVLPVAPERPTSNLPQRVGSFVGRETELASVIAHLATNRLVTVTGFGGMGKTSLAMEVGRQLIEQFPDGVWSVELADTADDVGVIRMIAELFEVPAHPTRPLLGEVAAALGSCRALLIVDSCEHLSDAVADIVSRLLASGPGLTILATSRRSLRVSGEQVWPIPPLGLDVAIESADSAALLESDCVRLFIERAREAHPWFEVDDVEPRVVARICRRLDAVPLAIEMAASRLRLLSAVELLARLDDRLGVLTSNVAGGAERHSTIRATIEWSYELLDVDAQTLFRRLAVFHGGFDMEAAEYVCSSEGIATADIVDLMDHLLDASLLTVTRDQPRRYGMLVSVSAFVRELLVASGEHDALRRRHAVHFASLCPSESGYDSPAHGATLERVATDATNFERALAWSVETRSPEPALAIGAALRAHWMNTAQSHNFLRWFPPILEMTEADGSSARADIQQSLAIRHAYTGNPPLALELAERMTAEAQASNSRELLALAVEVKSVYLDAIGDERGALELTAQALDEVVARDDPTRPRLLINHVRAAVTLCEFAEADRLLPELDAITAGRQLPQIRAWTTECRGLLAHRRGDLSGARQLLRESTAALTAIGRPALALHGLSDMVSIALALGEFDEAVACATRALGAARGLGQSIALALCDVGRCSMATGRAEDATGPLGEALEISIGWSDTWSLALVLGATAELAALSGDTVSAVVLDGASEEHRERHGFWWLPDWAHHRKERAAWARALVGHLEFERLTVHGAFLDVAGVRDIATRVLSTARVHGVDSEATRAM